MSLTALPSELDLNILEYVHAAEDQQALLAISCVSKYYHQIAEPLVYENIVIRSPTDFRIKSLTMTLLDRRDLAQHIKRFSIENASRRSISVERQDPRCVEALSHYIQKIQSVIHSCHPTNSLLPPFLARPWSLLFKGQSYVDLSRVSVDAALALVLMLSRNVQQIKIVFPEPSNLRITHEVMAFAWQKNSPCNAPCPFTKLAILRIESNTSLGDDLPHDFLRTSAQSLCVRNCLIQGTFSWPTQSIHLRKLELHKALIDPGAFGFFVYLGGCLNLREISLQKISQSEGCWDMYDVQKLVDLLARYVPRLECFKYDGKSDIGLPDALSSLGRLRQLHTLRLNLKSLSYHGFVGGEDLLRDTRTFIPPNLQHLDLGRFTCSDLVYMRYSHAMHHSSSGPFKAEAQLWHFVANPAPTLSLKSFALEVMVDATEPIEQDTRRSLSEVDMDLSRFANEVLNRGMEYCVYQGDPHSDHGRGRKCLIQGRKLSNEVGFK